LKIPAKPIVAYFVRTGPRYLSAARAYTAGRDFPPGDFSWSPLSKRSNKIVKRAVDIAVGLAGTAGLIPLTVILGPMIKLDGPGPIFFYQKREGRQGRLIDFIKFRTYRSGAEDESITWAERMRQRIAPDPRATRLGSYLRSHGLDETPQFWALLKGDLTLIGCRAYMLNDLATIPEVAGLNWRDHRRQVQPSLVNVISCFLGSDSRDPADLQRLEMYYLGNQSLPWDIFLLARAFLHVFAGQHR
jgi:lipopolysaccharide/colanic/teichoic acid biosynthesis glycosyltransferase